MSSHDRHTGDIVHVCVSSLNCREKTLPDTIYSQSFNRNQHHIWLSSRWHVRWHVVFLQRERFHLWGYFHDKIFSKVKQKIHSQRDQERPHHIHQSCVPKWHQRLLVWIRNRTLSSCTQTNRTGGQRWVTRIWNFEVWFTSLVTRIKCWHFTFRVNYGYFKFVFFHINIYNTFPDTVT